MFDSDMLAQRGFTVAPGLVEAEECRALRIPCIFDPGQQCARMSGAELRDGIAGARLVICNDYEFELIRQKTGMGEDDVLKAAEAGVDTDRIGNTWPVERLLEWTAAHS